ncbi:hypothetical protein [uncultured Tenacibaculum sp.]|uniref:hypothetical protein n=1 Tax=uncultured Tenacibaculum sp. TaxID=174713 RepID=UPI00262E5CF8|nr:hypothetical protein [uncultured Tenacibaculum sp.]
MKKQILNLGTTLARSEQKSINGGFGFWPSTERQCLLCGGEWDAPFCALPMNSVCL